MKYNIIFSIPIHERLEVVIDQIVNFLHFNPHCAIVFHVSQTSDFSKNSDLDYEEFIRIVDRIGDVYINPERVRTGFADIIQAHISNFIYVSNILSFNYFCLCASNELFISDGLYNSIEGYDCGFEINLLNKTPWVYQMDAVEDSNLASYLKTVSNSEIIFSHVEGSFYSKDLFNRVSNTILTFYNYLEMVKAYPREEVYFPTVAYVENRKNNLNLRIKENDLFTFVPWNHAHGYIEIRISELKECIKANKCFSVKRVNRELNDVVRCYIRNNSGLNEQVSTYIDGVKKRNDTLLCIIEVFTVIGIAINNLILDVKLMVLKMFKKS